MSALTRNQSADRTRDIGVDSLESAPTSTDGIRAHGVEVWLATYDTAGVHVDHLQWLRSTLGSPDVLDKIDELIRVAREAGGETDEPWRD